MLLVLGIKVICVEHLNLFDSFDQGWMLINELSVEIGFANVFQRVSRAFTWETSQEVKVPLTNTLFYWFIIHGLMNILLLHLDKPFTWINLSTLAQSPLLLLCILFIQKQVRKCRIAFVIWVFEIVCGKLGQRPLINSGSQGL